MITSILHTLLLVLSLTLLTLIIFRHLQVPVILGYIVVGTLVGPYGLALVPGTELIRALSEFGIVFLMFTIGLNFSWQELKTLKIPVFVLGSLQVLISILITLVIGLLVGMSVVQSLIIGGIVTLSSTAIVLKQLKDQGEMEWTHSHTALGILLFQDLAAVPLIIFVGSLSVIATQSLSLIFVGVFFKAFFALIVIFLVGRTVLNPLFHLITATRVVEMLTLCVLLIALSAATLTHALGLSYALGAFLAGMMLAKTPYQHQIEVEIRPFRDILLGLFFISVGMLLDIATWSSTWMWIGLLLLGLILGKLVLIFILMRLTNHDIFTSLRTALILAQGSEFSFLLLALTLHYRLIPGEWGQVILSALLLSMALAPLLIRYNGKLCALFLKPEKSRTQALTATALTNAKFSPADILLCGYGRMGEQIANLLKNQSERLLALDINPKRVQLGRENNLRIFYGDATHPEIIKMINLASVKTLVVTLGSKKASLQCITQFRRLNSEVPILTRCRDTNEIDDYIAAGATIVIPETLDSSFLMTYHIFSLLDIEDIVLSPSLKAMKQIHDALLQEL